LNARDDITITIRPRVAGIYELSPYPLPPIAQKLCAGPTRLCHRDSKIGAPLIGGCCSRSRTPPARNGDARLGKPLRRSRAPLQLSLPAPICWPTLGRCSNRRAIRTALCPVG
jgi:hypothetical protein